MSDKTECPGCRSYSSSVRMAFNDDNPCPSCGLSAASAFEILAVRERQADEELKAKLEAALVRAAKAEAEAAGLRCRIRAIESAVAGHYDEPSWTS